MTDFILLQKSIKYLFICLLINSCKQNFDLTDAQIDSTNIDDITNTKTGKPNFDLAEVKLDSTNIDDITNEKTGKPNFDLTEVKLGETNIDDIINEKTEDNNFVIDGNKFRSSSSKKILTINNIELQNQTRDSSFSNYVSFGYNKKNIITDYTLAYYTLKEDPKIVYNQLKEKIGPPSFKHFRSDYDKENKNYDAVIWEDKENNKFYRLRYHLWEEEGLRELRLTVLINSESDTEDPTYSGQPFYFWKDYINERKRLGNEDYTYQEFIKKGGTYRLYSE
ncbi:hypothetical protein [Olleya sp. HaHaR_3_96]|uniref:hypothetical protein n=1 Tax=Olleya sp. HaHaR_3_96 TaxID=2745560 RepID=UPI001C4F35A7|nr:hypothetical protein [Olleya sp. HaHaR_3_96]QXP59708.1 hypothetical protein H0I26_17640 [Olleya sp. HaHaR_3_96]